MTVIVTPTAIALITARNTNLLTTIVRRRFRTSEFCLNPHQATILQFDNLVVYHLEFGVIWLIEVSSRIFLNNPVLFRTTEPYLLSKFELDFLTDKIKLEGRAAINVRYRIRKKLRHMLNLELPLLSEQGYFDDKQLS